MRRSYPFVLAIACILLVGDRVGSASSAISLARFQTPEAPSVITQVLPPADRPRSESSHTSDHRNVKLNGAASGLRMLHGSNSGGHRVVVVDTLPCSPAPVVQPPPVCVDSASVAGQGTQVVAPQDVATGARF